jgi:hypothetical protein
MIVWNQLHPKEDSLPLRNSSVVQAYKEEIFIPLWFSLITVMLLSLLAPYWVPEGICKRVSFVWACSVFSFIALLPVSPPLCLWSNKYVYAFMTGRSSDSEHGRAVGYSFICMGFLWFGSLRCTCICMYVLVLYYKQKNKFAIATCIVP